MPSLEIEELLVSLTFPITLDDIKKIKGTVKSSDAAMAICRIVDRMSTPRALIVEPTVTGNHARDAQWTLAFDLAIEVIAETGQSVIDPNWFRTLIALHPNLEKRLNRGEHIFQVLIARHLIDTVYLPDDGIASPYHKKIVQMANGEDPENTLYRPTFEIGYYRLTSDALEEDS